jgi:mono/diheme cytochrome c family protein
MNDRPSQPRHPNRDSRGRPDGQDRRFDEPFSDAKLTEVHSQLARDKEEPSQGFSGTPVFLVFLVCALGFWAGVYLTRNAGGFSPAVFDHTAVAASGNEAPKAFQPDAEKGLQLYTVHCATCHQPTGLGMAGIFPPLAKSNWIDGNQERTVKIILAGIAGEMTVNGNTYNGNMPNVGAALKDGQIAHIVTYINQAWGNAQPPITDAEVAEVRKKVGARGQYSVKEILEQHPLK